MSAIKQEEDGSSRIQLLESEIATLKKDVKQFLSIIAVQTEQLARQEKIWMEIKDEHCKGKHIGSVQRRIISSIISILFMIFLIGFTVWIYFPAIKRLLHEDITFYLKVDATPLKASFITTGVKVRFTLVDLNKSIKGALLGN